MPFRRPTSPRLTSATARPAASGHIVSGLIAVVAVLGAGAVLAWMLLLPFAMQAKFLAATGAELRISGLMGDPFSGRARVTGWILRRDASAQAPILARGGPSSVFASTWREAFVAKTNLGPVVIDELNLHITEAFLAPDARGEWPLLALGAAAGLPFEIAGPIGDGPRVRIRHLQLFVEKVRVLDARTGAETTVRIAWRGEFRDLDHTRPVLTALLAAVRAASATPLPAALSAPRRPE